VVEVVEPRVVILQDNLVDLEVEQLTLQVLEVDVQYLVHL
jgi:hypothetical protein